MSPKAPPSFRWFGLCTLIWTAAWCGDLLGAWRHAPYDQAGPGAAALWLVALLLLRRDVAPRRAWLAAAWAGSLIGAVGTLHVAHHVALMCAVCAWLPWRRQRILAAITAVSWMPALGWALAVWSPATLNGVRLALATVMMAAVLLRRTERQEGWA